MLVLVGGDNRSCMIVGRFLRVLSTFGAQEGFNAPLEPKMSGRRRIMEP